MGFEGKVWSRLRGKWGFGGGRVLGGDGRFGGLWSLGGRIFSFRRV